MDEINHWKCSSCGEQITYFDGDGELQHKIHFDIERSNKTLDVSDGDIEIIEQNEKMQRSLCKECFTKALNESKTLGDMFLFLDKEGKKFIY